MAKKPRAKRKPLTLAQRVLILEKHVDGLVTQCQLELDDRLKAVEASGRKYSIGAVIDAMRVRKR
jgi:hypothetical protein